MQLYPLCSALDYDVISLLGIKLCSPTPFSSISKFVAPSLIMSRFLALFLLQRINLTPSYSTSNYAAPGIPFYSI